MKKRVYAYLHTHWDMEWYRDKDDFDIRLVDVVDGVIDELEKNRAPFFYLDGQVIALLNYLKIKPENKNRIIKLIKDKKLAIGPFYVSADTYLVNFVSMLKNLEIGLKYSNEFGQKDYLGYVCDVFGISNSIFEALKLEKIHSAVIWRGVNPDKINNNCNFIKNDVKTLWLAQGYFNDYLNTEKINTNALKVHLDKISKYSKNSLLMPIGADHLGILKNASKKIQLLNKELDDYEIILTSPFEYFKNSKFEHITREQEFLDNSKTYILGGVYSSRINQKAENAFVQNKLSRIVEPLNLYLKDKYERNILLAYETLIKNHAHDGICGCSLDSVAKYVDYRFEKCSNIIDSVEKNIIQKFKKLKSKTANSTTSIGLFNLSNYNNIRCVEIKLPYILKNSQVLDYEEKFLDEHLADIYKIPVTEEITKIYRQLVEVSSNEEHTFSQVNILKPKKKVKITKNSIENENIKLDIKYKKIQIFDKKSKNTCELLLTDIIDKGDSYNSAPCGQYKKMELLKTEILYEGDIQCCLSLIFKNIRLNVILDNNSGVLRFNSEITNKKTNHKLQLAIKTQDNITDTIAQDALGVVDRKIDYNYDIRRYMPAEKPYELKTNSYPMQSFVEANDVCVLTKGINEYEVYKNELRICLLRCFGTISNPKNPARYVPAGPNLKTPQAQMIGKYRLDFGITFGKYKDAFLKLDEFYANYIAIDGQYEEILKLVDLEKDEIFYGISKGKKIIYNLRTKNVRMI